MPAPPEHVKDLSKSGWIPAVYGEDLHYKAEELSPPPVQVEFRLGESVLYLSRTTQQWIPAVVQGHIMIENGLHYMLDVKEGAPPSRLRPLAKAPEAMPLATVPIAVAHQVAPP